MIIWMTLLSFLVSSNANNITIITSWKDNKFQVLNHFWRNTGFSPLGDVEARRAYLLSQDEKINLAIVGSVPNGGITHVRIHWILDLLRIKCRRRSVLLSLRHIRFVFIKNNPEMWEWFQDNQMLIFTYGLDTISTLEVTPHGPVFDYQDLDELIDWLHQHRLVPVFELMGNPSNYFHDFKNQSNHWSLMIKKIIDRYVGLYGGLYLYKWRFELMNEPDLKMYNSLNLTLPHYLEYVRSSEKALGKLLGPAGLFRNNRDSHPLCWGLLSYCNLNPCNLKMVTYHKKGEGAGSKVVRYGLDLINNIKSSFPNLTDISFGNDEADIMSGWHKPRDWRSDVRYASLVLQVVIGHISEMRVKRDIPFSLLSNDNAFMNYYPHYFTQRTLLARFQMNNTEPRHVQFFEKPVYSVMGLLSLLGSYVIDIQYNPGENGVSYVLTAEKYRTNFLGTVTNDRVADMNNTDLNLGIRIKLEDSEDIRIFVVYAMDNRNTNPCQAWKDGGSPDFPDKILRRKMRISAGVKRLNYKNVKPHQRKLSVNLPRTFVPAVVSVNICNIRYDPPGRVENLHFMKINANEVLLLWSDESVMSKCLLTYVIEFRGERDSKFKRINDEDSIFLSYHFDGLVKGREVSVLGEYRVVALDYFGRYGRFSDTMKITSL